MAQIDAYLFFDGNCAEAMQFYAGILGGKLEVMKYKDGPPGSAPPELGERVMHACITVGDRRLMASDTMPKYPHEGNKGFAVSVHVPSAAEAKRVFDALAAGGKVGMPIEKTFWAEAFGMLTDKFGIPWMIGGGATS